MKEYTPAQKEAYYHSRIKDPKATPDQKCYALFFGAGMELYEATESGIQPNAAVQEVAFDPSHPQYKAVINGYNNARRMELDRIKEINDRNAKRAAEEKQRIAERKAEMKSGFYRN